jgi:hypothetical protein
MCVPDVETIRFLRERRGTDYGRSCTAGKRDDFDPYHEDAFGAVGAELLQPIAAPAPTADPAVRPMPIR